MTDLTVLADMACAHAAKDVYDLWVQSRAHRDRAPSTLLGWQNSAGGNLTFCLDHAGNLHSVAVPWTPREADERRSVAESGGVTLRAAHGLGIGGDDANFGVRVHFDGRATEFSVPGASLLFPCVAFDETGAPHALMIRTEDVENADGVIDQHNFLMAVRHDGNHWTIEEIADLKYGLLPKAGVWGYPGRRRHPYLVRDDRGGLWAMWERKEPHDGNTRTCHGVLVGRRFSGGRWGEPVRIIEERFMDYAPDERGVIGGELLVAAQRAVPITERGRGEVVLLRAPVDDRPEQPEDTGWEGWTQVDLPRREYFAPEDRELTVDGESYRLLLGDPHTHTGLSEDAEGDLIEMLGYARDKAKLDFVAITDKRLHLRRPALRWRLARDDAAGAGVVARW
jgi:hypothetical protein